MLNKDKIKGYIAGLSTAIILCSTAAFAQSIEKTVTAVYNNIKIMIDGEEVIPKDVNGNVVEPFIIDGTTYLPVRAIANALGEDVDWDQATSTVYIGEKPASTQLFKVDSASLGQFSETTLATIGDEPVKGSYYNVNIAQSCNSASFQMMCDNYSADKTLQTITINSVPAAKSISDSLTESFKSVFAVYNAAEKSGFTQREDIKEAIDSTWNTYRNQFATEEEYAAFLKECAISAEDFEKFLRISTVYSLYADDLYTRYYQTPYTTDELAALCKENFVKVKHILVEDYETAQAVISKLKRGTSFDSLIDEYNLDSGQGVSGYTFSYGEMVEEFEKASFALKENAYTATPVESTYGYHIIYRYPIERSWIENNAQTIQSTIAANETNNVLEMLIADSKIVLTPDYDKYISTIK